MSEKDNDSGPPPAVDPEHFKFEGGYDPPSPPVVHREDLEHFMTVLEEVEGDLWHQVWESLNNESNCQEDIQEVGPNQLPEGQHDMLASGEHEHDDSMSYLGALQPGGGSSGAAQQGQFKDALESTPAGTGARRHVDDMDKQNRGYNMSWVHSFTRQELRKMRRHGLTDLYGIDNRQVVNFKAWQEALRKDPKANKKDFWFIVDVGNVDREGRVKKERDRQLLRIGLELVPDDPAKGSYKLIEVPPSAPA